MSFYLPPEWAPQAYVWFAWPTNSKCWPENRQRLLNRFAQMVSLVSQYTPIKLICAKDFQDDCTLTLKNCCALFDQIHFVDIKTDDVWCRDFGPIFIKTTDNKTEITDWRFNGWGDKHPHKNDNKMPGEISKSMAIHHLETILEGGAIEVNGDGLLITTEAVLLNQNRNAGISKGYYEMLFAKYFGVSKTIWLEQGLANDDTDGHVDNIARFVNAHTLLMATGSDPASANCSRLQENLQRVQDFIKKHGISLDIIEIPLPKVSSDAGDTLPASHLNFLITNDLVLVPTYKCATDKIVLGKINEIFPTKTVQGFDCSDFLQEGGAIHCLSQQQAL